MSDPVITDPPPEPPPLEQMETSKFCGKPMSEQKELWVELAHNGNPVGVFKGKNAVV